MPRPRGRTPLAVVAFGVVVFALAGCADGGRSAQPTATPAGTSSACVEQPRPSPAIEGAVTCTVRARVRTEVSGDETFTDEGTYELLVSEFWQGDLPEAAWFANLGMAVPQDVSERVKYRVGFDIAPGTYRGPGTYGLTSARPTVEGLSSPLESAAFLDVTSFDPARPGVFGYAELSEPCTVRVADRLTRGRLRCPKLGGPDGRSIALRFEWQPSS